MWHELLALIFPERCIGCGKSGTSLCAICERAITTSPQTLTPTTATLYDYRAALVKRAIWEMKYRRNRSLGKYFGVALYREFFKHLARKHEADSDLVLVPIPGSTKGLRERGFNHAEIIARTIAESAQTDGFAIPVATGLLRRTRKQARQVDAKTRKRRMKNMEDGFTIREGAAIRGKVVILIDDVITTGATVEAAKAALLPHRPKRVFAIAVAH